MKIEGLEITSN